MGDSKKAMPAAVISEPPQRPALPLDWVHVTRNMLCEEAIVFGVIGDDDAGEERAATSKRGRIVVNILGSVRCRLQSGSQFI
jgi:hypothetical protein